MGCIYGLGGLPTGAPLPAVNATHRPADERDVVFNLLVDRRRRSVLYELDAADGTVSVADPVDALSAQLGASPDPPQLRTSLCHAHLPKLAEGGLVEFDPDRGAVAPADPEPGSTDRPLDLNQPPLQLM